MVNAKVNVASLGWCLITPLTLVGGAAVPFAARQVVGCR